MASALQGWRGGGDSARTLARFPQPAQCAGGLGNPPTSDSYVFAAEVAERWDAAAIREGVLASQRTRRVLHGAMNTGGRHSWDYAPVRDVANEYVRNHMDWAEVGPRSRFPRIG